MRCPIISRGRAPALPATASAAACAPQRGSVLIIVIWVCLGLVALTLYFADAMTSELRAADNRAAEIAARQAVAGGTRYAGYVLSQFATGGTVPHLEDYKSEDLPVGDASFWFIGRDNNQRATSDPVFGLVDEGSKLNLATATRPMLEALPNMTPELVDAILSWKNRSQGGTGDSTYGRLDPPRTNKGAAFESVDELRLVYGATIDILFGEDANRNGALDDNENDGDQSAPHDNADGVLQPGILEYLTIYSAEPNTRPGGGTRVNVTDPTALQPQGRLAQILGQRFGPGRATQILANITGSLGAGGRLRSVAEFMVLSRLNSDEWLRIRGDLAAVATPTIPGLINVNTASEAVLACIPGIGVENASAVVAYRLGHPDALTSFYWLTEVIGTQRVIAAGAYITDRSYQFTADVAAVGVSGRGYCREKTVFDMTQGTPRIVYHQDLTGYGWALGAQVRQTVRDAKEKRT